MKIYKSTAFKHYCPKIKYRRITFTYDDGDTVSDGYDFWVFKRPYLFGLIGKKKWVRVYLTHVACSMALVMGIENCKKLLPKKKLTIKSNNQNELR
jgi:hypothetical protein